MDEKEKPPERIVSVRIADIDLTIGSLIKFGLKIIVAFIAVALITSPIWFTILALHSESVEAQKASERDMMRLHQGR